MTKQKQPKAKKELALKKDIRTIVRFFKFIGTFDKGCLPLMIVTAVVQAVTPFIGVFVPKLIIDEMLGAQRASYFIALVLGAAAVNSIFTVLGSWLLSRSRGKCLEIQEKCRIYLGNRVMARDYEDMEDPNLLDEKNKAALPMLQGGIWQMASQFSGLLGCILTMAGLIAVILTLNLFIIVLILLMVLLNIFLYQKSRNIQYETEKKTEVINREVAYFENLCGDFSVGKDIRLYGIRDLILDKIGRCMQKVRSFVEHDWKLSSALDGTTRANSQLQIALVYAYMTYKVFVGAIGIGDFTMYVSAANSFSNTLSSFFGNLIYFLQLVHKMDAFLDFVQIHPKKKLEGKSTQGIRDCEIQFKDVSFRYPRSKEYVLRHVSVTIHPGEKLSVVGLNGAGKTTFIKLLTRMYDPDEGEILINGVNIQEYGYQEYLKLLAVVFQDFKTLAFTIRENIALEESGSADHAKILDAIERAGLKEKVESLPKGIDTSLYKIFDEDGIEFSGGQNQKLAIARAIYKDAPIVVLDEPTAALDPISEFEIYSHFNRLIGDKTTIYISHRLSSCRFCDRIIVFSGGQIVQDGSHDELVSQTGSQYEQMYHTQAKYYV